jgi:hypothetical protein
VNAQEVTNATIAGIRFGNVIIPSVPARLQGESGAIGAAYMASNTVKVSNIGGGGGGGRYGTLVE